MSRIKLLLLAYSKIVSKKRQTVGSVLHHEGFDEGEGPGVDVMRRRGVELLEGIPDVAGAGVVQEART